MARLPLNRMRSLRAWVTMVRLGRRGPGQVAAPGGGATALRGDGPVHGAEAFLLVTVEVIGSRVAGLHAGLDHRMEQWVVAGLRRGHADRAVAAMVVVGADVPGFRLAEVRQAVEVAPVLEARLLGPAVEVRALRGCSTCR